MELGTPSQEQLNSRDPHAPGTPVLAPILERAFAGPAYAPDQLTGGTTGGAALPP